jgi:hypothetical protein
MRLFDKPVCPVGMTEQFRLNFLSLVAMKDPFCNPNRPQDAARLS